MTTGQRIQQARKKAGLSQKQLGEKLGLSASMIGQWENDLRNPKYDTLKRIAVALGVDLEVLFTDREREISEFSDIDGWCRAIDYYNVQDFKVLMETMKQHDYTFSKIEQRMIAAFSKMDDEGQEKAADYAEDILPSYRRQEPAGAPPASPGDTDTPAAQDAPEGAEKGE